MIRIGRFLGFEKEQAPPADTEGVVRRLGHAADLDSVFVHDFAEALGVAGAVVHVPAQQGEQRVEKVAPQLGFIVGAALVVGMLLAEAGDKLVELGRCGHWGLSGEAAFAHFRAREDVVQRNVDVVV